MSKIIKFFKGVRNHWKKSLFASALAVYGVSYGVEKYETFELMKGYSLEAVKYGDLSIPAHGRPPELTVILNPVANNRKAKKLFKKYCEPLLHLAGFAVTIIQTQSENHARNIMANLSAHNDVIVVAGGDGTLSDVVTGLMRKYQKTTSFNKRTPVGILPLGQNNRVANSLFFGYEELFQVRQLAEATMAIVRGKTKPVDVVEVELLEKDAEHPLEPIYAVGAIEWGAWNDARSRVDKYWYWGPLKKYVTFIINGLKNDLNWDCNGVIRYSDPCEGCSKCYEEIKDPEMQKKWWHMFLPRTRNLSEENTKNYSKIQNDKCGVYTEKPIGATELHVVTRNTRISDDGAMPSIKLEIGPENVGYKEFVTEGWRRLKGRKSAVEKVLHAKDIEIYPAVGDKIVDKERMFYIDNEEFELKPVRLKLLQNSFKMFCAKEDMPN